jgi:GntR family transcriptional regulator/MocR family aminotransferase
MWMDVFLDPDRPRRTTVALYDQIRVAVAEGRLRSGERLPTSRWLADDLGVSRSTITTVYGRLTAEGILTARVGDGTYVADQAFGHTSPTLEPTTRGLVRRPPVAAPSGRRVPAGAIDLRAGRPDPSLFPLAAWRRAVKQATEQPPPGYGQPAGLEELRSAIASWVGRTRGLAADPEQILVTAGAQQAFDLCAQLLVADGDTVAFEDPAYEPARRAFVGRGANIQPAAVDRDGITVEEIAGDARVVFVTPSHQFPTGATLSAERRRVLLESAHRQRAVVVEDDYDTEYRYVDRPLEPLHRLDPHGQVVYVGTFSKTLTPSLRIGFVVAPHELIAGLVSARQASDGQPPHLTQAALTHLIVTGDLDRHVRRTRTRFAGRHEVVRRRIDELHRDGRIAAPWPSNAGLHSMIELHAGTDAARLCDELAARGVIADTADDSWYGDPAPALVIGFGLADEPQLEGAFSVLAELLRP